MYQVILDKVTGIMVGDVVEGAYKSRKRFKYIMDASKFADRVQDVFNARHNSGIQYFPYWERRIVEVPSK